VRQENTYRQIQAICGEGEKEGEGFNRKAALSISPVSSGEVREPVYHG